MCGIAAIAGLTAVAAAGSVAQGYAQRDHLNLAADMRRSEAELERRFGAMEEASLRRRGRAEIGQQIVDFAAAGVSPSTGTALDVAFNSQLALEDEAFAVRTGRLLRAGALDNEAVSLRAQGRQAVLGGFVSAVGSLLAGAQTIASLR